MKKEGKQSIETLAGTVERVVFHSPESGYTVLRLKTPQGKLVDVVGILGRRLPGEGLVLMGRWEMRGGWGLRFIAENFTVQPPSGDESLKKYLSSDLVKGIGKRYAERLVNHFGEGLLEIVRENPQRLFEVSGIGKKKAEAIIRALTAENREAEIIRELSLRLLGFGIGPAKVRKIFRRYKGAALDVLSRDPFRLADEISGIGFVIADKIATRMKVPSDSPSRIRAGLIYSLKKASEDGHCFLPVEELFQRAEELLGVRRDLMFSILKEVSSTGGIFVECDLVYLPSLYKAERHSAEALANLANSRITTFNEECVEKALSQIERERDIVFTREQRTAVSVSLCGNAVCVITGGPGTGKTTVINAISAIATDFGLRPLLCAPTGRAANRLSQATGREAFTIHRLLEWTPDTGFRHNQARPLDTAMLILDEASMVDIELFDSLISALKPGTRFIIVGDSNQLPSVGPGDVLSNIVSSGKVVVVQLTTIHRQAERSRIIRESYNILRGRMPDLKNDPKADFFFLQEPDRQAGLNLIVDLVSQRLPKTYSLDPVRDIQVIVPMYKGICGANALNEVLRRELNFADSRSDARFFPGDKVMQTRNNYNLNIFNGDIGFVKSVTPESVTIDFGRDVIFDRDSLEEIVIAYAITAHKSQGGEVPCVVMPIYTEHFILLDRNLLYTAITRAKSLCVLVGQTKALAMAVSRAETMSRWTALDSRLRSEFEKRTKLTLLPPE